MNSSVVDRINENIYRSIGKKEMVIFISSPDSYSDVLCVFLQCFEKFCKDCPYEFVLSTNSAKYKGLTVYNNNAKNDSWMDRTYPVIKNLETDYILLLCDDLIITEKVDFKVIHRILTEVKDNNINFCGLTNFIKGRYVNKASSLLCYVKRNKPYAKTLQSGIIKKEFFLSMLEDGTKTQWELEEEWLKDAARAPNEYFDDIASCKDNVLHCENGVHQGRWFGSTKRKLKKLGIEVDSSRDSIPFFEEIKIKIFDYLGEKIPSKFRHVSKQILISLGFKFVSKY